MEDVVVGQTVSLSVRDPKSRVAATGVTAVEGEGVVLVARLSDGKMERPIAGHPLLWYRDDRQVVLPPANDPEGGDYADYSVARRVVVGPETEGLYWVALEAGDGSRLTSNTVRVVLRRTVPRTPERRRTAWYAPIMAPLTITRLAAVLAALALILVAWFGRGFVEQLSDGQAQPGPGSSASPLQTLPGPTAAGPGDASAAGQSSPGSPGTGSTGPTAAPTSSAGTASGTATGSAGTAARGRPSAARTAASPRAVRLP
jgi:hypothetical protein